MYSASASSAAPVAERLALGCEPQESGWAEQPVWLGQAEQELAVVAVAPDVSGKAALWGSGRQ